MSATQFHQELAEMDNLYRSLNDMTSFADTTPEAHAQLVVKEKAEVAVEIMDGKHCPKCGKNSMISYQVQIRRGDEGTNTMLRCTNKSCKHSILKH